MRTLAAIALMGVLFQEKEAVTVVLGAPVEKGWPISGTANLPDGAVLTISTVRVERRWEADGRFREFISAETRLLKKSEVAGKAFRTTLKPGPTGLYDVAITAGDQRVYAGRHLLGNSAALFSSTAKSTAKLVEVCDRSATYLEEIRAILAGKRPGTAEARAAFIKRIHADELLLEEVSGRTDLTASAFLLRDVCAHIRNAQVWERTGATAEELNDAGAGERDLFLDPNLTFKSLKSTIDAARTAISRELSLSSAAILDAMFARAEVSPDKLLAKAKEGALEALKVLLSAPVEDKEARAAIEAAARTEAGQLAEVRKGLQEIATRHRADP